MSLECETTMQKKHTEMAKQVDSRQRLNKVMMIPDRKGSSWMQKISHKMEMRTQNAATYKTK